MKKITIKNSAKIIDDEVVIKAKKKNMDELFSYLSSRSFDYFPIIVKENENNIYYEYIKDISEPQEQKIIDLVILLSLLHSKTTIYKEIDLDNYKLLYESISNDIDNTYEYYNNLINTINGIVYMSPSNYLIARNISMIFNALGYSRSELDKWYQLIKNKRKIRVVTLHNNISLEHYLKNEKPYFISWDNYKIDMPIYDIILLYKKHYLDFDFVDILKIYFSKYPFTKDEMMLFLTIISIPGKIIYSDSEYENVKNIRNVIDYLYKSSDLVREFDLKEKDIEEKKNK